MINNLESYSFNGYDYMLESQADAVTILETFFRVHHSPRTVFVSRQGNAHVLTNLGIWIQSFIRAVGRVSKTFINSRSTSMSCITCRKLNNLHKTKISVTNRTYEMINHTGEHLNSHLRKLSERGYDQLDEFGDSMTQILLKGKHEGALKLRT